MKPTVHSSKWGAVVNGVLALLLFISISPAFSQQIVGRKPLLGEQINWSHPLARGLVGVWLINEGSGGILYDATNNGLDLLESGTPDRVITEEGLAVNLDDGSTEFFPDR